MKKILFAFYFLLFTVKSFAQLSGSYTVGGTNPDYATLTDAAWALNAGVTDTVVFNIRPGTYNEMLHFYWVSGSAATPIIFQSEDLDSTSVVIHFDTTYYGVINSGDYLTFKQLTIINNAEGGESFKSTEHVFIENCLIKGIYMGNETYANNTKFYQNWWGSFHMRGGRLENSELTFDNAYFSYPYSNTDSLQIVNCRFNVSTVYASSLPPNALVLNNYFQGTLNFSSEGGKLLNNEINGELSTGVGSGSIKYNKVYGNSHISLSENGLACNNSFNGTVMCNGNDGKFLFNNLSHANGGNTFFIMGTNWQIWNNNLPDSVYDGYNTGTNVYGFNNYYPGTDDNYDLNAFHVDPQYQFVSGLYAGNPSLMQRGYAFTEVADDIDEMPRPNRPTIGANEICLSHFDTLTLTCGDSIPLFFCNAPQTGNYTWQPSTGLSNGAIASPLAGPVTNTLYIVTESNSGFVDSVYINVNPFTFPVSDYATLRCGASTVIHAPLNSSATYQWSPVTGLTDPQQPFTQATLFETTTYTVTVDINGCGTYIDSITILADSLPWPDFNYSAQELTVSFTNTSTCADEYEWDFGDSTGTSTDENPVYSFAQSGSYLVKLKAINAYGFSEYSNYINVVGPCSASFILYPDSVNQHNWFLLATGSGSSPLSYFWEWGDGSTSYNEPNPSHTYNEPGYYHICLTITDNYGCTAQFCDSSTYIYKTGAEMVTVNVINQFNVGIEEEPITNSLLIYPNPASNTLTINTDLSLKNAQLTILNAQGQLVINSTFDVQRSIFDISQLSTGLYHLLLEDKQGRVQGKKFVVAR